MRVLVAAALVLAAACGTPAGHKHTRIKPPTENDTNTVPGLSPKDAHFDEVKKAASTQLDCPVEKINIVCLRRDAEGECVMIRADGCDKSYEYQFGDSDT